MTMQTNRRCSDDPQPFAFLKRPDGQCVLEYVSRPEQQTVAEQGRRSKEWIGRRSPSVSEPNDRSDAFAWIAATKAE